MTNVTFELLRDTRPLSAARVMEVPDINVLLYTDRARTADETAGRIPLFGGDDNWVPRTRDQEQLADNPGTV
jgi:hypothetical protein